MPGGIITGDDVSVMIFEVTKDKDTGDLSNTGNVM